MREIANKSAEREILWTKMAEWEAKNGKVKRLPIRVEKPSHASERLTQVTTNNKQRGNHYKTLRGDMTKADASRLSGVSVGSITRIEDGKCRDALMMQALREVYNA